MAKQMLAEILEFSQSTFFWDL